MAVFLSQAQFASAGLIARYDFSGDATDSSGNGNDLAVFGATLAADRFGNANSAYKFDGTNDYMAAGFDSSTDNTFTWGFWLQDQSTTPSIRRWLSTNNSNGTPETVIIRENFAAPGGNLELHLGPGQSAEGSYVKGDWNFYTVVSDGSSMEVYIDSVLEAVNPVVSIDPEAGLFVGGYFDGSLTRPEFFDGLIDDIKLYDEALTQQEIEAVYVGVHEPSSIVMLGLGLLGLAKLRRRRGVTPIV